MLDATWAWMTRDMALADETALYDEVHAPDEPVAATRARFRLKGGYR